MVVVLGANGVRRVRRISLRSLRTSGHLYPTALTLFFLSLSLSTVSFGRKRGGLLADVVDVVVGKRGREPVRHPPPPMSCSAFLAACVVLS